MEKTIEISTLDDTNKKVNKIPFLLLITVNILLGALFFWTMMEKVNVLDKKIYESKELIKDSIVTNEYLLENLNCD